MRQPRVQWQGNRRRRLFDQVNAAVRIRATTLLPRWCTGGRLQGREFLALNPHRGDRHLNSFKINIETGRWADFATGDKGGDFVSFYAFIRRISQGAAVRELADDLGVRIDG